MRTITAAKAKEIFLKYNKEPFHIRHAQTVSGVMGYFAAKYDTENIEYWRVVGMLHDIDFEEYPDEHCVKGIELLKEHNVPEDIIYSAISHGYGLTGAPYEPVKFMEKLLYATDELTGLIWAAALMRPSKSTLDMEVSSVKKKVKDKRFAAGCSRDVIQDGAKKLEWDLDRLMRETLEAMQELERNA